MKTSFFKTNFINSDWYIIDANKKNLGRLLSKISIILQGKHKIQYSYNSNLGDYVILLNANKVSFTGDKLNKKIYYKHTEYPSGLKSTKLKDYLIKNPKYIIKHAIKGMLPKNKIGRLMIKKLKIFLGNDHIHHSNKPKILNI